MLRTPARIHLHPVEILPSAGSNTGRALRHADRHVVPGLHTSGAPDGLPPAPRGGRGGPTRVHHGASGHAAAASARAVEAGQELHQLQGLSALLHGVYSSGWHHGAQGRPEPPRQAPRAPGLQGPETGTEGLRGPALPGLHKALSGVGPGGADDAGRRAAPRVAPAPAAAPPPREGGVGARHDSAPHAQE